MVRLGGMLQDLECFVDNSLRLDGDGNVVGRNGGIRGWLRENLPELSPKYKTLMRYKAMAVRLRQATGTFDPTPTDALLASPPERQHEAVRAILGGPCATFASIEEELRQRLDPDRVFLDPAKPSARLRRRKRVAAKPRQGRPSKDAKLGHGTKSKRKRRRGDPPPVP